jgi:hypothetical protein
VFRLYLIIMKNIIARISSHVYHKGFKIFRLEPYKPLEKQVDKNNPLNNGHVNRASSGNLSQMSQNEENGGRSSSLLTFPHCKVENKEKAKNERRRMMNVLLLVEKIDVGSGIGMF